MRDSRIFVDTNMFIYAMLEDIRHKSKRDKAITLLQSLSAKDVCISTQVLNEIYSVMLKQGIDDKDIQRKLNVIIKEAIVSLIRVKTVRLSWEFRFKYQYSYWDSLILASAIESDCTVLFTEDMQDGQIIEGVLKIMNPFLH